MSIFLERGPRALLHDYALTASAKGPGAITNEAIRSQAPDFQELMALLATCGELTLADVLVGIVPKRWHQRWRYALAKTIAFQELNQSGFQTAEKLLSERLAAPGNTPPTDIIRFLAELRLKTGMFPQVMEILEAYPDVCKSTFDPLYLTLLNPASETPYSDREAWYDEFSSFFQTFGLSAPTFSEAGGTSYLDLSAGISQPDISSGPLVSVIVTVYRPDELLLSHSIESLLQQTWKNLEIIVVDDASGPDYEDFLTSLTLLDPRIKLVRQSVNQGTYAARNRGFFESTGEFVTGHDSDDWAHPERIARQVQPLLENAEIPGSMTYCLKVDQNMGTFRIGQPYFGGCQSTLMLRRERREYFGDYLPARKAVDSEYMIRVDTFSPEPLLMIPEPLELVLTDDDSLSGSDFGPGDWRHPARYVVRESYVYWHGIAKAQVDPVGFLKRTTPYVPTAYSIDKVKVENYDVVYAGDWQSYGGPQKSMLQEIAAHRSAGRTVAVMDLYVGRLMRNKRKGLNAAILELLTAREVGFVLPDQEVTAHTVFVRYPPALQFKRREPFRLRAQNVAILANQAPSERDGSNIRYFPLDVHRNATFCFGKEPLWIPQGPVVRSQLEGTIPDRYIAPIDFPSIVTPEDWKVDRSYFRSSVPVIGRHSRDNPMKWPDSAESMLAAYPDSPDYEVRSMGGTNSVSNVLGYVPERWLDLATDEMPVPQFLDGLDFYVFSPHPQAFESFGNAILEALASGLVVLLPPHFEATFGDGAVYCEPAEVTGIIDGFYSNPGRYREQSEKALRAVAERFSPNAYLSRFTQLFGQNPSA